MVFMGVILQTKTGIFKSYKIHCRIMRRLDLWEIGQYANLCSDTVAENRSWPTQTTQDNEETEYRTFKSKVVNGNIWAAVRGIWGQGQSEVLLLVDVDNKTGRPVMDVLREKHPVI